MNSFQLFDRLHNGFYVDAQTRTLDQRSAATFTDDTSLDNDPANKNLYTRVVLPSNTEADDELHMTLIVRFVEVVETHEEDSSRTHLYPIDSSGLALLRSLDCISSEKSLGERWFWQYRMDCSPAIKTATEDTEAQAWSAALEYAKRLMRSDGSVSSRALMAYHDASLEKGYTGLTAFHKDTGIDNNPLYRPKKVKYEIGDVFEFPTESSRAYVRRKLLKSLLSIGRFHSAEIYGYAGRTGKIRRFGRSSDEQKQNIRSALAVFDHADHIEVVGRRHKGGHGGMVFPATAISGSNFFYEYQLLLRATIDNRRVMILATY